MRRNHHRVRFTYGPCDLLRVGIGVTIGLVIVAAAADRAAEIGQGPLPTVAPSPRPGDGCEITNGVFIHGSRRSDGVALSFDACPTSHRPGFSPDIVDTLRRAQAPATFFVSGRWAEAHPDALRQLAAVPFFEVALHGHRHRSLRGAGREAVGAEIEDGRRALERLGVAPRSLFRPPFGDRPPELAAAAARSGVVPVLWDVVSGDPDPALPPATLARNVLRQARGGSIIVMHANGRGIASAAALPELIVALRARGLRLVSVGELVQACGVAVPAAIRQTDSHK